MTKISEEPNDRLDDPNESPLPPAARPTLYRATFEYAAELIAETLIVGLFGVTNFGIAWLYGLLNLHGEELWVSIAVRTLLHLASVLGVINYAWKVHGHFHKRRQG